ncbi:Protein argonaute 1B [Cercospora zeina]
MAANQDKALPPDCVRCFVPGHKEKKCQACKNCCRYGHQQNTCPYNGSKVPCDHCLQAGHAAGKCPQLVTQDKRTIQCQAKDCKKAEPTWLHPHVTDEKNTLTAMQRATICGTNHVEKSTAAKQPKVAPIHRNGNTQANHAPSCNTPIYGCPADKSNMVGHGRESVITNYVKLPKTPQVVHEYRIGIVLPPTPGRRPSQMTQRSERKRVFNALRTLPVLAAHDDYFTDYDTLWTCSPLDQALLSNTDVEYVKQSGRTATVPSVTIEHLHTLDFSHGSSNLVGKATEQHNPNLLIKALNGMVTKCITERQQNDLFEASANSFYLKTGSQGLGKALLINRGYFTSVRPGQHAPLLNVNIMHGTFLRPTVVSTFLGDMNSQYGDAEKILKGRTVRVMYERGCNNGIDQDLESNRKKQIAGFGKVPRLQQFDDGARMWTVKEWFEGQGLTIREPNLPCVNVGLAAGARPGGRGALWIPAEYLEIEPYQTFGKMLNSDDMRVMLGAALKPPAANQAAIVEEGLVFLGANSRQTQDALEKSYNFQIGHQLLQIPAQFLKAPVIRYLSTTKPAISNASWDVARDRFLRVNPALQHALPLGVLDLRLRGGVPSDDIGLALLNRCRDHGMLRIDPNQNSIRHIKPRTKQFGPQKQFSPEDWELFLDVIGAAWKGAGEPKFVLVLIDQNDPDLYAAIKLVGDHWTGFKTVVCTNNKLPRQQGNQLAGHMSNLALKFNIKCGGQNHAVESDKASAFSLLHSARPAGGAMKLPGAKPAQTIDPNHTDTIVIGVDVVHPGGDTPSIAAMVGTEDHHFANLCGSVRLQPGRMEILTGSNTKELFEERLRAFKAKNDGKAPRRLLYYRDGVSEDEYYQVLEKEVQAIQEVLPEIAITAIVVGKRHHTRFFCADSRDSYTQGKNGINGNAKPGLLVDTVITQPITKDGFRDFFLQSHAAIRGTAKSAHYIVIRNDKKCNLDMSAIHNITHAFCYNYARATKGVSYCAPAYYADRLCDRMHGFLKLYMRAHGVGEWSMNPQEQALLEQNGKNAAILAFRTRIAQEVSLDDRWTLPNRNPWHPDMDDIMFWL